MNTDKVIEVLEILLKSDYTDIPEISKALTQAISLIKENGELKAKLEESYKISDHYDKKCEMLRGKEKDLSELKAKYEAVASEGLGVEEMQKIVEDYYRECYEREETIKMKTVHTFGIAKAIHEAQTKYKKELLDKAGER